MKKTAKIYFLKGILLTWFIFAIGFNSFSQGIKFEKSFYNLNTDNGLASSEVYKVGQDSKGKMWFCTDAGVTQFDGFNFKTYTVAEGMTDNVVFDFYEDKKGRIWFLTFNSLLCYLENGKIVHYKYNYLILTKTSQQVATEKTLFIDKYENLYYSLKGSGLIKISKTGKLEQLHKEVNTYRLNHIEDQIIISFNFKSTKKKRAYNYRLDIGIPNNNNSLDRGVDSLKRMWNSSELQIFGKNGCLLINDILIELENYNIIYHAAGINRMGKLNSQNYWIAKMDGLLIGKIDADKKFIVRHNYLIGNEVTDVFQDSEGGYWISTLNNGIYYTAGFDVESCNENSGLLSSNIVGIAKVNHDVWVSYNRGWQTVSNGLKNYSQSKRGFTKVNAFLNNLIVANMDYPNVLNKGGKIYMPLSKDFYTVKKNLYCVSERVYRYNLLTKVFDTIYDPYSDFHASKQSNFSAIACDKSGNIILGNLNGLFWLREGNKLERFIFSNNEKITGVTDILFSEKWGMVVATSNQGVFIFKNNRLIEKINTSHGLISNNVNCLAIGKKGRLFIGTSAGVNIKTQGKPIMNLLAKNQGIIRPEVNTLLLTEDYIYIGTRNGLYRVDYEIFEKQNNSTFAPLKLSKILVNDRDYNFATKLLTLPYSTNSIKISFEVGNFKNWHNKRYKYQLSPDEPWIEVNYPEIIILQAQNFLEIKVCYLNDMDIWSKPYSLVNIQIQTPIWKQWYFYVGWVGLTILALFIILRKRQKHIERILRMKNDMLSLEQRIQSARLNPHFVFNVLNSIHSCLLFNENELAEKYLLKFSGLMRDIMKTSGDSSINIYDEIEILTKYLDLENLRHNEAFSYSILQKNLDVSMLIPSMIVQPFVENSIIHGVSRNVKIKGEIIITYKKIKDNLLEITIEDNGETFNNNIDAVLEENKSHAIGITLERISNYNKMFNSEQYGISMKRTNNEEPKTIVVLYVPILKT